MEPEPARPLLFDSLATGEVFVRSPWYPRIRVSQAILDAESSPILHVQWPFVTFRAVNGSATYRILSRPPNEDEAAIGVLVEAAYG